MDLSCSVVRSPNLAAGSSETVIVVARDSPFSQGKREADSPEGDSDSNMDQQETFSATNTTNPQAMDSTMDFTLAFWHAEPVLLLQENSGRKKTYKCRQNCQCLIRKEMRNMCRACRFQKCEMLGMNKADVQMNRDPIGRRKENSSTPTSTTIVECCVKPKQCCSAKPEESVTPVSQPATTLPSFQSHLQSFINSSSEQNLGQQQEQLLSQAIATSMHHNQQQQQQNRLHEADNLPALGNPPMEKGCLNGFNVNTASLLAMPQAIKYSPAVSTTSTPAIAFIPYSVPCGPSMLQRMLEGFINFQSSQKSLYTVMYPEKFSLRKRTEW
uniref:Nuclear receptor domain-containing protein n=1 Tax=Ditylenchus dipsaci TaxID=166011 RepID=A0A915D1W8_9BILA